MNNLQAVFPKMVFPKMNNLQTFSSALKSAVALVKIITSFPCSLLLCISQRDSYTFASKISQVLVNSTFIKCLAQTEIPWKKENTSITFSF